MKKTIFLLLLQVSIVSCLKEPQISDEKNEINLVLDSWHKAAAAANYDLYFSYMAPNAVFIGTDPTENWQLADFKKFSKPFFDKGKAWSFNVLERHIYFPDENDEIAWFDELLQTQMKICRGSGVIKKTDGKWKIEHYVLSVAIPNSKIDEVVLIKTAFDNDFMAKMVLKK